MIHEKYIRTFWYMSNNFGDNINYFLLKNISGGKDIVYTDNRNLPHVISCGSILTEANQNTLVWGAGFAWHHDRNDRINLNNLFAVRGELTAERFDKPELGIGDPAILMKKYYNPKVEKKYKYGVIPHWKDTENIYRMRLSDDILIISPLQSFQDVVQQILSCEKVVSSSLHGLIFCDTYGVPNSWMDLGNDIGGDGFKFLDYYSSTETGYKDINSEKGVIFDNCAVHPQKEVLGASQLLKYCPFYKE